MPMHGLFDFEFENARNLPSEKAVHRYSSELCQFDFEGGILAASRQFAASIVNAYIWSFKEFASNLSLADVLLIMILH